jgi:hypothetical protein
VDGAEGTNDGITDWDPNGVNVVPGAGAAVVVEIGAIVAVIGGNTGLAVVDVGVSGAAVVIVMGAIVAIDVGDGGNIGAKVAIVGLDKIGAVVVAGAIVWGLLFSSHRLYTGTWGGGGKVGVDIFPFFIPKVVGRLVALTGVGAWDDCGLFLGLFILFPFSRVNGATVGVAGDRTMGADIGGTIIGAFVVGSTTDIGVGIVVENIVGANVVVDNVVGALVAEDDTVGVTVGESEEHSASSLLILPFCDLHFLPLTFIPSLLFPNWALAKTASSVFDMGRVVVLGASSCT